MNFTNLNPETIITYVNGSDTIYTGTVKQVSSRLNGATYYTVIDHTDNAAVELWNLGFAIGAGICSTQIKSVIQ